LASAANGNAQGQPSISDTSRFSDRGDQIEVSSRRNVAPTSRATGTDRPVIYVSPSASPSSRDGSAERPYASLQSAIDAAPDGAELRLAPGTYTGTPTEVSGPRAPNDPSSAETHPTAGFRIEGKSLTIRGDGEGRTIIDGAGADYGLYVDGGSNAQVRDLTITGARGGDDDANADAGLSVRDSRVDLERVTIEGNGEGAPPEGRSGVRGVSGRGSAEISMRDSTVRGNTWDGVALYENAAATIDRSQISENGHTAVGATGESRATVTNSIIGNNYKGIGAFGSASVTASNNDIVNNGGWGLSAEKDATLDVSRSTIAGNGEVGVYAWDGGGRVSLTGNVFAGNGHRPYKDPDQNFGPGALRGLSDDARIEENLFSDNAGGDRLDLARQPTPLAPSNRSGDPVFQPDTWRIAEDSPFFGTHGSAGPIGRWRQ
jgi:parallel beta helix pectate lyase-like protein